MNNILTIGYLGEGTTDERFIGNIIKRTFEELAFECKGQIEVYEPRFIKVTQQHFVEQALEASKNAKWLNILCIHTDADAETDEIAFQNKINPAINAIHTHDDNCKNIVAVVPIYMTEAWMLADRDLLRDEIGTDKTIEQLNLPTRLNQIERNTDPKKTIQDAIDFAFIDKPKRKKVDIGALYTPISQQIDLSILENLSSYQKFKNASREALRALNYLE